MLPMNTGTEAVETARKWGYLIKGVLRAFSWFKCRPNAIGI